MAITIEEIKTAYQLECLANGQMLTDDGFVLSDAAHPDYFLRTVYDVKDLVPGDPELGIYRFADWLPVSRMLSGSSAPVTYQSEGLGRHFGLENLFITFSGYWPEMGVEMQTGTFKECEAYSVCARIPEDFSGVLVVASAGNTARAFARVCSENNIPLLLLVPTSGIQKLWFKEPLNECVKLIEASGNSDYYDAIQLANTISSMDGYLAEGGAKNVARRDGMGTTVLSAITTMEAIPDYYFQAVGSGTGAVAAWEANLRFIESGKYGTNKMSLQVAQNKPFLPIHKAWKKESRHLLPLSEVNAKKQLGEIYASVLANRQPCYSIHGGLYDALSDTYGNTHAISNNEAKAAQALFEKHEGNDIEPAAAVALGSLIKMVEKRKIDKRAKIMLNITGGGIEKFKESHDYYNLRSSNSIDLKQTSQENIQELAKKLFS